MVHFNAGKASSAGSERVLAVDAVLYGAALTFALFEALAGHFVTFGTWARFAFPTYLAALAATAALAAAWRSGLVGDAGRRRARVVVLAAATVGACIAPLVFMVHERAATGPDYAQSEVIVVESATDAAAAGRNPYDVRFDSPELDGRRPAIREHFPYLPGMLAFGIPRAVTGSPLGDARVWFTTLALLIVVIALRSGTFTAGGGMRVWQVLVVLPPGALAIASGGDDVPVVALCLASVVALDGERPGLSGLCVATASLLKATAWPFLLAVGIALVVRGCARQALAVALAPGLIAAACLSLVPGAANDLLAYPLHLTALESPVSDPTLMTAIQSRASGSPVLTAAACLGLPLLLISWVVLVAARRGWLNRSQLAAKACALAGGTYCLMIASAPAWRPGYALYPTSAFLWAVLLAHPSGIPAPGRRVRHNADEVERAPYLGG